MSVTAVTPAAHPSAAPPPRGWRERGRRMLHGPAGATGWPTGWPFQRLPNVAMLCLVGYMFVVHSGRLPVGQVMVIGGLMAAVVLSGKVRVPTPLIWFGALVAWAAVTAVLSSWNGVALTASYEFVKIWLIAFLTVNAIRTRAELRQFVLLWLGLFALFPLRGTVMNYLGGYEEFGRYHWNFIFGNPNDLASFCLLQVSLCVALLQVERVKWIRICAALGILSLGFVIVITQSRGGMLALGTLAIVAFMRQRRKLRAVALVGLAGLVVLVAAPDKVFHRLGGLTALVGGAEKVSEVDPEQSAASRYAIWRVAFHIFASNPVTGAGWGTYPLAHESFQRFVPDVPLTAQGRRDAHGTYTKLLAETGVPGLILFLGVILSSRRIAMRTVRRMRATGVGTEGFLLAMITGQTAYLQAAIFGSYQHLPFLYMFTMLMIAAASLLGAEAVPGGAPAPAPVRRGRLAPRPRPELGGAWRQSPPHLPGA